MPLHQAATLQSLISVDDGPGPLPPGAGPGQIS